MLSINCWIGGVRISEGCNGRAFARSTGCPMRAIFRMDISGLYGGPSRPENRRKSGTNKDHWRTMTQEPTFRFCPACGGALETRQLKAGDPARLVCTRCGYIHYFDPKVAVGTIITTGSDDRV